MTLLGKIKSPACSGWNNGSDMVNGLLNKLAAAITAGLPVMEQVCRSFQGQQNQALGVVDVIPLIVY